MTTCRGCGKPDTVTVLDLGSVPAADCFPLASDPVDPGETSHTLAMVVCRSCGLAQLDRDDTVVDEPRGVEPEALKSQAAEAVRQVAAAGWLRGDTVLEFGSPHGGTWVPMLEELGFRRVSADADVVIDCFGIMHEPDQRSAFHARARALGWGGVLLLQFHSLMAIVRNDQWNALRHGHFAYYSLTSLMSLLNAAGLQAVTAWEFDLYGGTVLVAAVRGDVPPDVSVNRLLEAERSLGIGDPVLLRRLQGCADAHVATLTAWLERERRAGRKVLGYGAASRAVAVFSRAGLDSRLIGAVADASHAKQGRRMPGTDIPIISPQELLAANPDGVLLTLADLLPEVSSRYPELAGRWRIDGLYDHVEQTVADQLR